jgi:acetyl-CoA carboxylase carboxyltransferase component
VSVHEPNPGFRRLEVPVLTDSRGRRWVPGVIDVTLRHEERTVIAESPPPGLPRGTEKTIREMAGTLARAGVAGAVTVTFFADPRTGEFRFVETAPRLPAERALLESTTGLDLTALQLHLSRGGSLEGEPPEARGHAVELFLSARDPEADLAPAPGVVEVLRLPSGPGLRADAAVEEGDALSGEAPGIVRVTAHGRTRAEALSRLQKGLARTVVILRGGTTDKAFLSEVLERPEMDLGTADPSWLDHLIASGEHLPRRGAEVALLEAAIRSHESENDLARARFQSSAARGRPEVPRETGHSAELRYRGQAYLLRVARLDARTYRVEAGGVTLELRVEPRGRAGRRLAVGDRSWRVFSTLQGNDLLVEVDGIPHRISREAASEKENPAGSAANRISFAALRPPAEGRPPAGGGLEEVRLLLLGYDVDPKAARKTAKARPAGWEAGRQIEEEILRIFVDVSALFRRQPIPGAGEDARHSAQEYLFTYLRDLDGRGEGLPAAFLEQLARALAHYGIESLERSTALEESLFRIAISHGRLSVQVPPVLAILERHLEVCDGRLEFRDLLDRLISETQGLEPAVHDLAREVRYRCFDRPLLLAARDRIYAEVERDLTRLDAGPGPEERAELIRALVECPQPLHARLSARFPGASPALRRDILEVIVRRYYRIRELEDRAVTPFEGQDFFTADYEQRGALLRVAATHDAGGELVPAVARLARFLTALPQDGREVVVDLYLWSPGPPGDHDEVAREIGALLAGPGVPQGLRRIAVSLSGPEGARHFTFRPGEDGAYAEDPLLRGLHPMMAQRVQLWRLRNFRLKRLPSPELVYLFHGVAHENPKDERLVALAEVRDLTPVRDASGRIVQLPQLEHMLMEALAGIRRFQSKRAPGKRLQWNRVLLSVWPPVDLRAEELNGLVRRLAPLAEGLGLEKVIIRCRIPDRETGELRDWVLQISNPDEAGMALRFRRPAETPLKPLRAYAQKVVQLKRRGLVYPYEIVKRLAPPRREAQGDLPPGEFVEHDLDAEGRLVPVDRPYGQNTAGVVVGVVRSFTGRYPEGMARVLLLGDPSRGMGALSEPECRRILAALDLADRLRVPIEWFALSAGAMASTGNGTTDWIGLVLRRIVELTQKGLEVNVVVVGLNAGAQPYWNAEAAMLMHTRGIVVMIPEGAMVLAGKQALDDSGDVSAEDDQGIGGYERIMGPNGQAHYFARDLGEACRTLLRHYEHTWVAPGERFPRPVPTGDPRDRDVRGFPHGGELATVGDVLSETTNPGRGKPFEIRRVMSAVIDQDHAPLERWYGMRDAEIAVVWDACLGSHSVCLLGFESKPLPRLGFVPVYGPDHWTGGTLSPLSAKKVARAINCASGNRPLVILANLSGFDGSPESMRHGQLEYGAEIGRALVNFQGPIVLCVLSRDPGGTLVVFSAALNDNMEVAALEGGHAAATIAPEELRPYLIEAVERGMGRAGEVSEVAGVARAEEASGTGEASTPSPPRVSTLG